MKNSRKTLLAVVMMLVFTFALFPLNAGAVNDKDYNIKITAAKINLDNADEPFNKGTGINSDTFSVDLSRKSGTSRVYSIVATYNQSAYSATISIDGSTIETTPVVNSFVYTYGIPQAFNLGGYVPKAYTTQAAYTAKHLQTANHGISLKALREAYGTGVKTIKVYVKKDAGSDPVSYTFKVTL